MYKFIILISVYCFSSLTVAEMTTYEWRNKDGSKVFTDRPPPKGIVPTRIIKTTATGGVLSAPGFAGAGNNDNSQLAAPNQASQTKPTQGKNLVKSPANNETCDTLVAAIKLLANSPKAEDQSKLSDLNAQYSSKCQSAPANSPGASAQLSTPGQSR